MNQPANRRRVPRVALRLGVLTVILLLGPTAQADVLQIGIDAARTGVSEEPGPKRDEVAWTIQLPGSVSRNPPLIIGDQAYITTSDLRHRPELDKNAIWEVSLADGSATSIIELDDVKSGQVGDEQVAGEQVGTGRLYFPHATVTDGDRFYVAGAERAVAYDRASGAETWDWPYPKLTVEQAFVYCAPPALAGRFLILACTSLGEPPGDALDEADESVQSALFVAALDVETGNQEWMWVRHPAIDALHEDPPATDPTCTPLTYGGFCGLLYRGVPTIVGVSVIGPVVVASVYAVFEPPTGAEYKALVALDMAQGDLAWIKQTTKDAEADQDEFIQISLMATGDDSEGYLAFRDLFRINPATGDPLDRFDLAPRDELSDEISTSFALTEDRLFLTTARTIMAVDRYDFETEYWATALPFQSTGSWDYEPLSYADGVVYGRVVDGFEDLGPTDPLAAVAPENTSHFQAYDASNGDLLWSHTIAADFAPRALALHSYTVAAGLLVVAGQEGRVEAIGRTDASLEPVVMASGLYPAIGINVTLDATRTTASSWDGADASTSPSGFRVDWGDGTSTAWQTEPVFSHAYDQAGDREAVLYVRNGAGQQSAEAMVFHVGGTPPPVPHPLVQFIDQNPDAAWGIFGLLVVLVGAAFTSHRVTKRRGVMARELAAIDAAAEEAGMSSSRLRAAMDERRARAHGLLLDHRIDGSQYQILGQRIDEAGRSHRLDQLRDLFDFLPHAIVRALERMLEDGQITSVEHRGIKAMLDDNGVLSKTQKKKVARLVDEWFRQDEGGTK